MEFEFTSFQSFILNIPHFVGLPLLCLLKTPPSLTQSFKNVEFWIILSILDRYLVQRWLCSANRACWLARLDARNVQNKQKMIKIKYRNSFAWKSGISSNQFLEIVHVNSRELFLKPKYQTDESSARLKYIKQSCAASALIPRSRPTQSTAG